MCSRPECLALKGLLSRKVRWGLSRRGWAVLVAGSAALAIVFIGFVHPFLAITDPVPTETLVVEGWLPNDALKIAIAEYRSRPYREIVCTGGPFRSSIQTGLGDTHAHSAAYRLEKMGIPRSEIEVVPSLQVDVDRTFATAVALNTWAAERRQRLVSFNLLTLGPHARRSRLLYQRAFGKKVQVGIIAVPDSEYNAKAWWKSSQGAKSVVSELIGYVYARFFFPEPKEKPKEVVGAA